MAVHHLAEMTWEEVHVLDRAKALAILPVGAVEAHGPHLPLTTDIIISQAMARSGSARLAARGHEVILLPPIAYTVADFAAGFAGTISLSSSTVTALLIDIGRALSTHGVAILALANSHLDPTHLASLEDAVDTAKREAAISIVFPDLSKKPWALRLTEEFKSGACHAGQFETSVVLAERPELVREDLRQALIPNPHSIPQAIRDGRRSFEEAGGARAYFGNPAGASTAEGSRTIDTLGAILEDAVLAALEA